MYHQILRASLPRHLDIQIIAIRKALPIDNLTNFILNTKIRFYLFRYIVVLICNIYTFVWKQKIGRHKIQGICIDYHEQNKHYDKYYFLHMLQLSSISQYYVFKHINTVCKCNDKLILSDCMKRVSSCSIFFPDFTSIGYNLYFSLLLLDIMKSISISLQCFSQKQCV